MTVDGTSRFLYKVLSLLIEEYSLALVEQTLGLLSRQALEDMDGVLDELTGLSSKIDRIVHVRSVLGCGLKEAKLYVEENFTDNGYGARIYVHCDNEDVEYRYRDHSLPV